MGGYWGGDDFFDRTPKAASVPAPTPKPAQSPEKKEEKKIDWQAAFVKALKATDYDGVKEALANGANPEVKIRVPRAYDGDLTYQTAMFYVMSRTKDTQMMDVLVAGGANVNAVDGSKKSLLRAAIANNYTALALHMAKYDGVDFSSAEAKAAYELAAEKRHKEPQMETVYRYLHMKLEELQGPWRKTSDDSIKYVSYENDGMTEISETFNFRAARQSRTIRDFDTKSMLTTETYFADIPVNAQGFVREAFEELKKQGGGAKIDPHIPGHMRRYVSRKR
ncbi:MAG: ankyrin repeat domain-containing protein [Alphaproteobacteria bacterium]|nr:MAG: ankyrin repeat domain-containing protein [Alphaproteobacteria bacterium]